MSLADLLLKAAEAGVTPEVLQVVLGNVEQFGGDVALLVRTAVDRNVAEEIRAKTAAARELLDLAARPDLIAATERDGSSVPGALRDVALELLANVQDLVEQATAKPEEEPPEAQA